LWHWFRALRLRQAISTKINIMSCFVLTDAHINTACCFVLYNYEIFDNYTCQQIMDIGKKLSDENIKSYKYRYPNYWQEDLKDFKYQFKLVDIEKISLVQFIKLLDCIEYQSCEHRSYQESFAYTIISKWRSLAFEKLQHLNKSYDSLEKLSRSEVYDQAEWAI